MRLSSLIKHALPSAAVKALDWRKRFEAAGVPPAQSIAYSLSRAARADLSNSRIEQLPPELRRQIPLAVDAGANRGQWLSALRRFARIDRAEVFEPNPEAFNALSAMFATDEGIRLHECALGAAPARMALNVTASSDLASLLNPAQALRANYHGGSRITGSLPVQVVRLDDVLGEDDHVDLLKIDVQGFEKNVLDGARRTLARTRAIIIEMNFVRHYEGELSFGPLYDRLIDEFGFEFWDISPPHRNTDGRALWADAVFVRV